MRDKQAHALLWAVLDSKTLKFLESSPRPTILDVGGDDGSLTAPLAERGCREGVFYINRGALRLGPPVGEPVRAFTPAPPLEQPGFRSGACQTPPDHPSRGRPAS